MLCRPGDDLLSQVLRHSTIGAGAFDGRVRDGIGSCRSAEGHQAGEEQRFEQNWCLGEGSREWGIGSRVSLITTAA